MSQVQAPEQRTIDVDVQDLDTRGKTVVGYAAVYGAEAKLDGFTETIERGAFGGVLDDDVRCLLNHDPNVVLGRTKSGTLRLADDQRGLRFEVDLPESRTDLREAVARGDLDGASFRFVVGEDQWEGDRRTITRVGELKDITLATYPAYPDTSIELRTRDAAQRQKEQNVEAAEIHEVETPEERTPAAGSLRVEERAELHSVQSLADVFEQRGFPNSTATVSWDEFRALTWSGGTVLTDINPTGRAGVALGYDQRWAYPAFPSTSVDSATTAVQVLRQSSRTLAAGTAVVRPLDSVTTKPEVDTVTELISEPLKQVAAVSSNVPNIHGEQVAFRSMVETDLRLSISGATTASY